MKATASINRFKTPNEGNRPTQETTGIQDLPIIGSWFFHHENEPIDMELVPGETKPQHSKSTYPVNILGMQQRMQERNLLDKPVCLEVELSASAYNLRAVPTSLTGLEPKALTRAVGHTGSIARYVHLDCIYLAGYEDIRSDETLLSSYVLSGCPDRIAIQNYGLPSANWTAKVHSQYKAAKRLQELVTFKKVGIVLFISPHDDATGKDMTLDQWKQVCDFAYAYSQVTQCDVNMWYDGDSSMPPYSSAAPFIDAYHQRFQDYEGVV